MAWNEVKPARVGAAACDFEQLAPILFNELNEVWMSRGMTPKSLPRPACLLWFVTTWKHFYSWKRPLSHWNNSGKSTGWSAAWIRMSECGRRYRTVRTWGAFDLFFSSIITAVVRPRFHQINEWSVMLEHGREWEDVVSRSNNLALL